MNENINNENANNENNDIRFDVENTVDVVSSQVAKKKNIKLPVIIVACVLLVAVICGIVWFIVKNGDSNDDISEPEITTDEQLFVDSLYQYINQNMKEDMTDEEGNSISKEEYVSKIQSVVNEATTTLSENVGSYNPNTIVEKTTAPITQGVASDDTANVKKAEESIKAFFNRSCYIKGAMYGGGYGDALSMSMDGSNFEALTNLDGTEVSILSLDGKLYIKRLATKQYLEMTDAVMDLIGFDSDDFNFDFGTADYSSIQDKLVGTYDVEMNGKKAICHEYKNDEQIYRCYSINGELKEIDICDSDGVSDTQLVIDYFSQSIPGNQLTLKGFTAASITVIFADLM